MTSLSFPVPFARYWRLSIDTKRRQKGGGQQEAPPIAVRASQLRSLCGIVVSPGRSTATRKATARMRGTPSSSSSRAAVGGGPANHRIVKNALFLLALYYRVAMRLPLVRGILVKEKSDLSNDISRRRLGGFPYESFIGTGASANDLVFGREEWEDYRVRCGSVEVALYLSIGVHLALYAHPTIARSTSTLAACHPLWLHADSSGEDGKVKGILPAHPAKLPDGFLEGGDGSLKLGTFRFQDVAHAFDAIEVDALAGHREYNVVTNNCAVLLLGMMRALGIQLSPDDRQKVADGLVAADEEADHKLANYVRASGEIERSLGLTQDSTDAQLLERLTLRQIELALDSDPTSELQSPPATDRDLIIQGDPVTSQLFPFIVEPSNELDGDPCSAVLVAPDVILTTALRCECTFCLLGS